MVAAVPPAPLGGPEKPTTRFLSSSRDSYVLVVLIGSTRPPSLIAPPGNVTLFSLSAWDTWNIETRFSSIFSESTEIRAWRSTVPATSTLNTPSTPSIAGTTRDSVTC